MFFLTTTSSKGHRYERRSDAAPGLATSNRKLLVTLGRCHDPDADWSVHGFSGEKGRDSIYIHLPLLAKIQDVK